MVGGMSVVDSPPAGSMNSAPGHADRPVWSARRRRRPWLAPVAVGVGALLATAYTGAANPNTSHAFPLCPLKLVTGLDCPLCGGLRGVHSLLHGDLVGMADHNLLLPIILPVAVISYGLWLGRSLGWALPRFTFSPRVGSALVLALTAFAILRNLPIPGHDLLNSTAMMAGRAP